MKRKGSQSFTVKSTSKKAKPALVKQKSFYAAVGIGDERKFNDVAITADANTTSTEIALTTFAAGDTALLRDGNKILVKSIELKILLTNSVITQNNSVRLVLYRDDQANAAQGTYNSAGAVFDAATIVARRNIGNIPRYKILMDKVVQLNQTALGTGTLQSRFFKKYIKLTEDIQLTCYADGTSAIPIKGAITLAYIGTTAAGTDDVTMLGTARVNFVG